MRRTLAVFSAIAFLLPTLCFAVFQTPEDILTTLLTQKRSWDFSIESHGQMQQYYLSVWSSGSVGGVDASHVRANIKSTVDMSNSVANMRVKLQLRIVDRKAYVMIDNIEGKYDTDIAHFLATFNTKKWLSFDMPAGVMPWEEVDSTSLGDVNHVLQMTRTDTSSGMVTYTLSPVRAVVRAFIQEMHQEQMDPNFIPTGRPTSMQVKVKLDATKDNVITAANLNATITDPHFLFTAKATFVSHAAIPSVPVPSNALPFDQVGNSFFQNVGSSPVLDALPAIHAGTYSNE
jgi:hypothetical protein